MKTRFSDAFEALRGYLASNVPGISSVVTHWVNPPDAQDGLAMLFPHSNNTEDGRISCGFNLWFHTVRPDPREVAAAQVAVMEEVFDAVYRTGGLPPPILKGAVRETEYGYGQKPEELGDARLARALIELTMEFDDDGN